MAATGLYNPKSTDVLHVVEVDIVSRNEMPNPIHLVQYDQRFQIIQVGLWMNNEEYVAPTGVTVSVRYLKPDGTFVYNPALGLNAARNIVYVEVTQEMTTVSGRAVFIVELVAADGKTIGSASVEAVIDRNPVQNDGIESTSEFKTLIHYVGEAEASKNAAKTSETNAANSAKAAKTSETNAKTSETNAANSAKAAKASQDAAKVSETNAKASENAAKASQDAAKVSETNAANSAAAALASQNAAKASQDAAKVSETNAKASETKAANSAAAAKTSETNAANSANAASASATAAAKSAAAAKVSETNAAESATNAETAEGNALISANKAKTSETNAAASAAAALASQNAAKTSETKALTSEQHAKTSETNAKASETKAGEYAAAAKASQDAAKVSETNAKTSETNANDAAGRASVSAGDALQSAQDAAASAQGLEEAETNAANSAAAALASQNAAKISQDDARASAANAKVSETNARTSETNAKTSETNASNSAKAAFGSANAAANSELAAMDSALEASSYARDAGDASVQAAFSALEAQESAEKVVNIEQRLEGTLHAMGTVTFANLPALTTAKEGDMYNVSDAFTTTADFKEGSGKKIPAGSNVYKTADGKWDVLAGTLVTGVKGKKESAYRLGDVSLTPENIGALPESVQLANDADLNTITTPGFYFGAGGNNIANKPDGASSFGLIVMKVSGGSIVQIMYTDYTTCSSWYRAYYQTWKEWTPQVIGIKGNWEANYRGGNVNLTPENLGAVPYYCANMVGASTDWNDIVEAGSHKVQSATMDAAHNAPVGEYAFGILVVILSENPNTSVEKRKIQLYFPHNLTLAVCWARMFNGSAWKAWERIKTHSQNEGTFVKKAGDTMTGGLSFSAGSKWINFTGNNSGVAVANSDGTQKMTFTMGNDGVTRGLWDQSFSNWVIALGADKRILCLPPVVFGKSQGVGRFEGTHGTVGWVVAVQIKITAAYANHTIEFEFGGRGRGLITRLAVLFANVNSTDPAIAEFQYYGGVGTIFRIKKTATSTYQIAVQKSEGYGVVYLARTMSDWEFAGSTGIQITYPNTMLSAAPDSTWQAPTEGGTIKNAVTLIGNPTIAGATTFNSNVTVGGTLQLNRVADAEGGADNRPALIVGPVAQAHIEIDQNEIMAKNTATTTGTLSLNYNGGDINLTNTVLISRSSLMTTFKGAIQVEKAINLSYGAKTKDLIRVYDDGQTSNVGLQAVIGSGGNMFIGSGESAASLYTAYQSAIPSNEAYTQVGEAMYLTSDSTMFFFVNCNSVSNRVGLWLNYTSSDGIKASLSPTVNMAADLGGSSYKWRYVYAWKFVGDIGSSGTLGEAVKSFDRISTNTDKTIGLNDSKFYAAAPGLKKIYDDVINYNISSLASAVNDRVVLIKPDNNQQYARIGTSNNYTTETAGAFYIGSVKDSSVYSFVIRTKTSTGDSFFVFNNTTYATTIGAGREMILKAISVDVKDDYAYSPVTASAFNKSSSLRYKENVKDLALDETEDVFSKLRPVKFDYKNKAEGTGCVGLIAEEVEKIYPYAVTKDKDGRPDSIDYSKFTGYLIKMVQRQQDEINELRKDKADLEARLERLEKLMLK